MVFHGLKRNKDAITSPAEPASPLGDLPGGSPPCRPGCLVLAIALAAERREKLCDWALGGEIHDESYHHGMVTGWSLDVTG